MNDIKSLFEPIKRLHETIRQKVVEACENSALEDLSRIVQDDEGDTIQVDVTVANVADGLLDSMVIVDFMEELRDEVKAHLLGITDNVG